MREHSKRAQQLICSAHDNGLAQRATARWCHCGAQLCWKASSFRRAARGSFASRVRRSQRWASPSCGSRGDGRAGCPHPRRTHHAARAFAAAARLRHTPRCIAMRTRRVVYGRKVLCSRRVPASCTRAPTRGARKAPHKAAPYAPCGCQLRPRVSQWPTAHIC